MYSILCTGHGSPGIGCGYEYEINHIEVSGNVMFAICPDCETRTDLDKTYEDIFPFEAYSDMIV